MTNLECLRAATSEAAKAVRVAEQVGQIKAGLKADIIAFKGNPLEDLAAAGDVDFVMHAGKVVK